MEYIRDFKKLEKINQLAKDGDEKAKDFLFNFKEMEDDEINEYLSSIAVDEPEKKIKEKQWQEIVESLIQDENEAIDGYNNAIKYLVNSNIDEKIKNKVIDTLTHIKDEELEHIRELKEVL